MPKCWQIVLKRSEQTAGVWALSRTFTVRRLILDDYNDHAQDVRDAATEEETAADALDTAEAAVRTEYKYFESMNVAIRPAAG